MKKIFIIILFLSIACSKKDNPKLSADMIYKEATKQLLDGNYSLAAENFESIDNEFVIDDYINKALIMSAYSYYKSENYKESLRIISFLQEKLLLKEELIYLKYLEIINNDEQILSSFKNINVVENTLTLIENFINLYPISIYNQDLVVRKNKLINLIFVNHLNLITFNLNNKNIIGAVNYLQFLDVYYKKYNNIIEEKNITEFKNFEIKIYNYLNIKK